MGILDLVKPKGKIIGKKAFLADDGMTTGGDLADEKTVYDYRGDIHEILDLEGVGPAYAKKLHGVGIYTSEQLSVYPAKTLAGMIDEPVKRVQGWQAMAELAKVKGIGMQYAEGLVRAGIGSISALRKGDASALSKQVNDYMNSLDVNVLGQTISEKRIATWQAAAAGMKKVRTRVVLGEAGLARAVKANVSAAIEKGAGKSDSGRVKKTSHRNHVSHEGWKLYEKSGRFSFRKDSQAAAKKAGYAPVYEVPEGHTVVDGAQKPKLVKD